MGDLFQELKRRNVFRVGAAYAVLSWLVLQVGAVLAPILGLPEVVLSFVIFALVLGLPMALLLAWAWELTPDGLKRATEVAPDASVTEKTGRKINRLTTGILVAVIALLLVDRFLLPGGDDNTRTASDVTLGDRSYDSIAVLPFVNMSDDAGQEFFSDGISEELLNLLAKTRGLRVAARTSSFAFKGKNEDIKGIGEQLDVETVLEGSVRKADTKLRITAQLIDVESGYHLWSETYDRELTDVFAIQDEISASIVAALAVHFEGVAAKAPTSSQGDVRAYEEYLQGRKRIGLRTKEDIEAADAHFKKAIEIDPDYAPAWTGRADAIMLLSDINGAYGEIPRRYAFELARPMIDKALLLDPMLPDAHNSQGFLLDKSGDKEAALESLNRAIELRPSFPIAFMWKASVLDDLDRWGEASEAIDMAHRLDPKSRVILSNVGNMAREAGDLAKMEGALAKLRALGDDNGLRLNMTEGYVQRHKGELAASFKTYGGEAKPWEKGDSSFPLAVTCLRLAHRACALETFDAFRFFVHVSYEDFDSARTVLAELEAKFPDANFVIGDKIYLAIFEGNWQEADRLITLFADGNPYSEFGPLFGDPDTPLAFAWLPIKQALGDDKAVAQMIDAIERFIVRQEIEGLEAHVPASKAIVSLYRGDEAGALEYLKAAKAAHRLVWSDRTNPIFAALHDNPDFQTLFDEVDAHVNAERVKLGWEPMEPVQ